VLQTWTSCSPSGSASVHHQFDDDLPEALTSRTRLDVVKSHATYEDAIGCLPSVANMWRQNVIDFARASENRTKKEAKGAENAWSKRSVRCLSRR